LEEKNDAKAIFLALGGLVAIIMFMILFSRKNAEQSEKYRKTFK
jgi:hypothetical protein